MSANLEKEKKINLSKEREGLSNVMLGLGWDIAGRKSSSLLRSLFGFGDTFSGSDIDCDASAFLLNKDGKLAGSKRESVIYFGNLKSDCGSVIHTGDNLTGEGDGDDEQLIVDLNRVPSRVKEIVFAVNIYRCRERGQHFGLIHNAYVRIIDTRNSKQLAHFNLSKDYSGKTAIIFGSLKRVGDQWEFVAIGEGTTYTSISEMVRERYM